MKKILLTLFSLFLCFISWSQEVGVGSVPLIEDCGFFFLDSGISANDYTPNEDLTTTICTDGTGENFVNIYFAFANLGNGDTLRIYDGDDATAPSLGVFWGNQLNTTNITSSGPCITVNFTSNDDQSVGSFGATVNCEAPCNRPFVIVNSSQEVRNPSLVCVGEEITLDASPTQFFGDAGLSTWEWNFDDGTTDNTSWPTVTHSFDTPGAYKIELSVTDNTGCESGNFITELIFVATIPQVTTSIEDPFVCTGQEVELIGEATPVTYTDLPDGNFGEPIFVPDDQNQCFASTLTYQAFSPGSSLLNVDQLLGINVNFEHSYMGDLVISIICPDGSAVVLHQQNGGGTYLGEPVDVEGSDEPGIGYDYTWSPTATNGTWAENSGGTLEPGTYESANSLSGLEGCPLNGEWQLEICDLFGADNGFVFGWSIDFDPSLYPDIISFTPSIGIGPDSTFWSGNAFSSLTPNMDTVAFTIDQPGIYTYTYNVFDSFGCTHTYTETVEVYPGPQINAGDDILFCGEPVDVEGTLLNPVGGVNYTYSWGPASSVVATNGINSTVDQALETTSIYFSVVPSTDPQCIVSDTLLAIVPLVPPTWPLDSLEFCSGFGLELVPDTLTNDYEYIWTYADRLDTIPWQIAETQVIIPEATGYYYLTLVEPLCGKSSITPYFVLMKPCAIRVPNVFSPNGDSKNDNFIVEGIREFDNSTVQIFNRWGTLVYENTDYKNTWSPEESEIPDGVYYYIVGINKPSGLEYFKGELTILR